MVYVAPLHNCKYRWLHAHDLNPHERSGAIPSPSSGMASKRPIAGCVWVASRCRALQRSARLPREIIQFFEGFEVRERTLNLRVVGSIPTRLTIDSKGLSASTTRRFRRHFRNPGATSAICVRRRAPSRDQRWDSPTLSIKVVQNLVAADTLAGSASR